MSSQPSTHAQCNPPCDDHGVSTLKFFSCASRQSSPSTWHAGTTDLTETGTSLIAAIAGDDGDYITSGVFASSTCDVVPDVHVTRRRCRHFQGSWHQECIRGGERFHDVEKMAVTETVTIPA